MPLGEGGGPEKDSEWPMVTQEVRDTARAVFHLVQVHRPAGLSAVFHGGGVQEGLEVSGSPARLQTVPQGPGWPEALGQSSLAMRLL